MAKSMEGAIKASNGLRQGYTMAPTISNFYVNLVVEMWCQQCSKGGITVLYKLDGRLGDSRSSKLDTTRWNDLQFANDMVIFAK